MTATMAKVSTASRKAREAVAARDQAIRAAYRAGKSLRQIAELADLSPAGVAKIVKRDDTRLFA